MQELISIADSTNLLDSAAVVDIVNAVLDTIPESQQLEFYKELLASQKSTYELYVFLLLGILTVFVGGTLIYNIKTAKEDVKKHVERILEEQKEEYIEKIRKDYQDELNVIKGDSARLFAIMTLIKETPLELVVSISWWGVAVKCYSLCAAGEYLSISVKSLLTNIQKANNVKQEFNKLYLEMYDDYETINEEIDHIPDILSNEKKEIKTLLDEIKNAEPSK